MEFASRKDVVLKPRVRDAVPAVPAVPGVTRVVAWAAAPPLRAVVASEEARSFLRPWRWPLPPRLWCRTTPRDAVLLVVVVVVVVARAVVLLLGFLRPAPLGKAGSSLGFSMDSSGVPSWDWVPNTRWCASDVASVA